MAVEELFMVPDSTRPDWPFKHVTTLTPHPRGSWCKKIDGQTRYFGPWRLPDPGDVWARAALKKYLAFANSPGSAPTPTGNQVSLELVVNHWLGEKEDATRSGELTPRQYGQYKTLASQVLEVLGRDLAVAALGPAEMKRLRDSFAGGPSWLGSQIRWSRGIFKWGQEYYGVMPRYGGMFSVPARSSLRRARKEFKAFTPAEIRKFLKVATPAVKCFILLGLNCGFGQMDCATLPTAAVDLKARSLHFPRQKTGIERRCPLWPETVKALKAYRRPVTARPDLFFITRFGRPYVNMRTHNTAAGLLDRAVRVDAVHQEFAIAQQLAAGAPTRYHAMKQKRPAFKPRGFYVLRHMFRSIAEETGKLSAIRCIMGHAAPGMDEYYLHLKATDYRDLQVVTDHLHSWLYDKRTPRTSARRHATST